MRIIVAKHFNYVVVLHTKQHLKLLTVGDNGFWYW